MPTRCLQSTHRSCRRCRRQTLHLPGHRRHHAAANDGNAFRCRLRLAEDRARDVDLVHRQGVLARHARATLPQPQALEHPFFHGLRVKQPDGMHAPPLAEPIDAPDALLEAQWIPRQLQVDDEPAAVMQVQAFTGGVRGHEHVKVAAIERFDDVAPHVRWRCAADRSGTHATAGKRGQHGLHGVAVLGEDDRRLLDARERAQQPANLRSRFGGTDQRQEMLDRGSLFAIVREPGPRQHRRVPGSVGFVLVFPRQRRLHRLWRGAKEQQPPRQRSLERQRARCRAPGNGDGHELNGAVARHHGRARSRAHSPRRRRAGSALPRSMAPHQALASRRAQSRVVPCSPEYRDAIAMAAEIGQVVERGDVPGVRRRRHQHAPWRARRQPRHGAAAIGARRQVMRLVCDQHIERHLRQGRHHLGTFHEINRGDDRRVAAPRVDAGRQCRRTLRDRRLIEHLAVDVKAVLQLGGPGSAQPGGAQHERAIGPAALAQLGEDQSGLDGLAKADGVGQQQSGGAAQHRERRFELVGQQIDRRPGRGPQARCGAGVHDGAERRAKHHLPLAPHHSTGCDGHRPIEWFDDAHAAVGVGGIASVQREHRTPLVGVDARETPPLATKVDDRPRLRMHAAGSCKRGARR